MLAREAFDEILTGFERFDHHIKIGLIDIADAKETLETLPTDRRQAVQRLSNIRGWTPDEAAR